MRAYVVRIHDTRDDPTAPETVHGLAEEVGTGRRVVFRSAAELWSLLTDRRADRPGAAPTGAPAGTREE